SPARPRRGCAARAPSSPGTPPPRGDSVLAGTTAGSLTPAAALKICRTCGQPYASSFLQEHRLRCCHALYRTLPVRATRLPCCASGAGPRLPRSRPLPELGVSRGSDMGCFRAVSLWNPPAQPRHKHCWLINEGGGLVVGKPAAKVREGHGHGVGDDRLPSGPVRPAAHGPPGHHPRPGFIDKEPPVVRPRIARALGFDGRDHKAIQRATLGHRAAPGVVRHGSRVRRRAPRGAVYRSHSRLPRAQPALLLTQTGHKKRTVSWGSHYAGSIMWRSGPLHVHHKQSTSLCRHSWLTPLTSSWKSRERSNG